MNPHSKLHERARSKITNLLILRPSNHAPLERSVNVLSASSSHENVLRPTEVLELSQRRVRVAGPPTENIFMSEVDANY